MVKFFLFFALNFELLLISETLGILCAGLHRNELVGMIILATFYVPLLMFTGFIQVRSIPCSPAAFSLISNREECFEQVSMT